MIINIEKNKLLNELIKLNKIIPQNFLIPLSLNVLIKVEKNKIILISSDGDISIKSEISNENLNITETGNILIRKKLIIDIICKIEDEFIIIEKIKDNLIKIKGKKFISTLNILNSIDYPILSFESEGKEIYFSSTLLKEIILQTKFTIGKKEKRNFLNGLNIKTDKKNKKLTITSTDSFRLSYKNIDYNENYYFNVIIPGKFINKINYLIPKYNKKIIMNIDDKSVIITINNLIIKTKIIDEKYPDINKIIPTLFNTSLTINTCALIKIIERATFSFNKTISSIITLKIKEKKVLFTSFIKEISTTEEEINDFILEGIDQTISFNSKYFLEALKTFKTKEIVIKIIDETKPLIIIGNNDCTLKQLILPIKIN